MGLELVRTGRERGSAPLTDIVGRMRQYAARLESGAERLPYALVWVAEYDDGSVMAGNWGALLNKLEAVGIMTLGARVLAPDSEDVGREPAA